MTNNNYLNKASFIFLLLLFLILLCTAGCNNSTDPQLEPDLKLELEDVSCTEAWITLATNNLQLPATLNLLKNNSITKTINLQTAHTLLYIDSLLPNQTYNFQAIIQSSNQSIKSNEIAAATLDTTSHNFTWQTWTFGEHSSSTLYDVAIVNENCIWAVGEIYVADTSANGYTMYNAVHWDGVEWTLKRIMFKTICGQQSSENAYPASSIIAFTENEIWVAQRGDQIAKIENGTQTQTFCMPWTFTINKIWGTSGNDLYVVGNNGNIAHYNGSQWRRIESGTEVNINDVFGVINPKTNQKRIFCAVSFVLQPGQHKILTIDDNNNLDSLKWDTGRRVNSTWSNKGTIVYTSGGGIFNNKGGEWVEETSIPLYYTNRIRGNGLNDIFAAGDFGLLTHFNGISWKIYDEFLFVASSLSVSVKDNILAAVGRQGGKSLVIIGKRN